MPTRTVLTVKLPKPCQVLLRIAGKVQIFITLTEGHKLTIVEDTRLTQSGINYNRRIKTKIEGQTFYLRNDAYDKLHLRPLHDGSRMGYLDEAGAHRLIEALQDDGRAERREFLNIFCSNEPAYAVFKRYMPAA